MFERELISAYDELYRLSQGPHKTSIFVLLFCIRDYPEAHLSKTDATDNMNVPLCYAALLCSVVKALQAYIERFERGSERYCCLRCAHTKWILPRPPSIWAPSKKSLDSKKSSVSSLNLNQFCQSPSQVESGQSKLQHAQTQAHAQLHCDWLEVRTEPYLTQVLLFDSCTRRSYQSKKL